MSKSHHTKPFTDPGDTIYQLMCQAILVECPRCGACATHRQIEQDPDVPSFFAPRRLICPSCALTRVWRARGIHHKWNESPARDDCFKAVLWIRGQFRSHEVWAYNWRHLDLIEQYVAATHRQHARDPKHGWVNRSILSRLPTWLTSAQNRRDVLATIVKIRHDRMRDNPAS